MIKKAAAMTIVMPVNGANTRHTRPHRYMSSGIVQPVDNQAGEEEGHVLSVVGRGASGIQWVK